MWIVLQIIINGLALWLAAYLVPGIVYSGNIVYLLFAGLVMGLVNILIKPVVTLLSLPLIILTLGLFYLVVNGLMLALVATLLPGLTVQGCMPAILGGIVIGVFNWVVRGLVFDRD
ncbi:MAG: phage holin family protein [Acidobacteriota bacterium]|nr:phage holin family protein [Acidobacteriota bacterium]